MLTTMYGEKTITMKKKKKNRETLLEASNVVDLKEKAEDLIVCPVTTKVNVKLSLCFSWAPRHEGVMREWRCRSTHSLTSALDRSEWSASRPGRFTAGERAPGTHWIGGWVCPRAVLDAVVKRKNSQPPPGISLRCIKIKGTSITNTEYQPLKLWKSPSPHCRAKSNFHYAY
jgi:hypothetical protein